MYKVVIIDDEPIIVEGLSRSLPWEEWGCQVAGFAYDGLEGMELIRREKPEIIISDISMPQLDGLNMIAGLKSEFPNMQITILTGFLLKPSKMEELKEAISTMTHKLKEQNIEPEDDKVEEDVLYNNAASSFIVKNALDYIHKNYKEKLRLIDVADQTKLFFIIFMDII